MDRFAAMQVFARVVECGSFTKAADTLGLARASVTETIQQLEARLRVKLLHRTTRKVNVTNDGALYYQRVVKLLAEVDDAEASLAGGHAAPRGLLRVDAPSPLARLVLIPALPDFHRRHPLVRLHLGASDRMVDLVDENVDCVLRGGGIADPSLVARRLADLPLGLYAAPGYLRLAGTPAHPNELEDTHHRTVGYLAASRRQVLQAVLRRGGEIVRTRGRHALAVDDGNAYLAAGLAGLGILWLPDYMAAGHVASGELVRLLPDWQLDPMSMHIAWRPNRHVSPALRGFIDWVVDLIGSSPAVE